MFFRHQRKRVLIFNDNAKRDLLGIRLLELALNKRGIKTQLCTPSDAKIKLRKFRPHALVAARADIDIVRRASSVCKVFIVAGEGGQQTKETMLSVYMGRGYWKLESVDWVTRCYLWSNRTKGWLLDTGLFDEKQLFVSGSPRLDIYRHSAKLGEFANSAGDTPRLGVAFSAKSTSTYYGKPKFASVYFEMHPEMTFPITQPGRQFEDVVWRDHAILRNMMRVLRKYLDNTNGEVWLRPSPFEDPKEFKFLEKLYPGRVKIQENQTLPDFVTGVDAILTCWSTLGLEGLITKKPVISIAGLLDQQHLFSHISPKASGFETFAKFYHQPESEEELLRLVDLALDNKLPSSPRLDQEVDQLLWDLYNWPGEQSTCALIADDIAAVIADTKDKSSQYWKKKLPFRVQIPIFLATIIARARFFVTRINSGSFKSYSDFQTNKDKNVEALLRKLS